LARQNLLLVDGDPASLRLTEISLKKAGFSVTPASSEREALEKCQISPPDLVISETRMGELDGFELCRSLREDERFRAIPFVFLTGQKSVEDKVRGLELGVDDYLTKPIYIKEIVARVRMLLQRRDRERLERKEGRAGFTGSLGEMAMVDLVQTLEMGRKSGVMRIVSPERRRATVWFRDGQLVDCETGSLAGEGAFYRVLHWSDGDFAVEFGPVEREARIRLSTRSLLLEGMRQLDEWGRLAEQMPALECVLEVDGDMLSRRLAEIPDDVNATLRLFDGQRTLQQVIEDSGRDDLGAAATISRLYFEGILKEMGAASKAPPPGPASLTPEPAGVDWFAGPLEQAVLPHPDSLDPPEEAPPSPPAEETPAPPGEAAAAPPAAAVPPPLPHPQPEPAAPAPEEEARAAEAPPVPAAPTPAPQAQRPGVAELPRRPPRSRPAAPPGRRRTSAGTYAAWMLFLAILVATAAGVVAKRRRMQAELAEPTAEALQVPPSPAAETAPVAEPEAAKAPAERAEASEEQAAPPERLDGAGTAPVDSAAYRRALDAAEEKYRAGAFLAAVAEYRLALEVRETSEALAGLGRALYDARRTGEALRALDRAVELDGSNQAAWLALGEVHLSRGERGEARTAYRNYLRVAPGGAHADEVRQVLERLR